MLHRPCGCSRKTYEHVSTVQSTKSAYLNQFGHTDSVVFRGCSQFEAILVVFPHFEPISAYLYSAMFQRIFAQRRAHREPRDLGASPGGVVEALVTQDVRFALGISHDSTC